MCGCVPETATDIIMHTVLIIIVYVCSECIHSAEMQLESCKCNAETQQPQSQEDESSK